MILMLGEATGDIYTVGLGRAAVNQSRASTMKTLAKNVPTT